MRKRTGNRNRYRSGRSTYSLKNKGRQRDHYGAYSNGHQTGAEIIAGRVM